MSFNYECDFNLQALRLTPIAKRLDVRLAILESLSEPIQWNRDNFFDEYLEGDSSAVWDVGTNYVRYDRVNYQNRIYECTNDIIAELPTNTSYWVQVLADFRGATERIKYNCQTIMLEWILNKWFGANFEQPSSGIDSDFFIVDNPRDSDAFEVAEFSEVDGVFQTSEVPEFAGLASDYVGEAAVFTFGANFIVYYPVAVIASTSDDKYFQMTSLINKYKIFGSTVDYISY